MLSSSRGVFRCNVPSSLARRHSTHSHTKPNSLPYPTHIYEFHWRNGSVLRRPRKRQNKTSGRVTEKETRQFARTKSVNLEEDLGFYQRLNWTELNATGQSLTPCLSYLGSVKPCGVTHWMGGQFKAALSGNIKIPSPSVGRASSTTDMQWKWNSFGTGTAPVQSSQVPQFNHPA